METVTAALAGPRLCVQVREGMANVSTLRVVQQCSVMLLVTPFTLENASMQIDQSMQCNVKFKCCLPAPPDALSMPEEALMISSRPWPPGSGPAAPLAAAERRPAHEHFRQ